VSTGKDLTPYFPSNEEEQKIVSQINHANSLFKEGEYAEAIKIYSQLLKDYSSEDNSFETALLTNICLGYLEQGERQRFKECARKLEDASKNLSYLPRETQMVLELNRILEGNNRVRRDSRIESRISDGLTEVFKRR